MKRRRSTRKIIWGVLLILCMSTTVVAAQNSKEERDPELQLLLPVSYDFFKLGSQTIHSPGTGLILAGENIMAVGFYTFHSMGKASSDSYPTEFHSLEFVVDGHKERHTYLVVFKSDSDRPLFGGLNTIQSGVVYGYQVLKGPRLSVILGGGLALGDFGIENAKGEPWPLMPVPLIRMNYNSTWLGASFEFLTGPNLFLTIAPEKKIRFTGDFRMDQFRDIQDLIFENALHYRFFTADHPMGDLAGVSIGIKNDIYAFDLAKEENPLEIQYYALFGAIDLSLLKISSGYTFTTRNQDNGFFLSLQGIYPF